MLKIEFTGPIFPHTWVEFSPTVQLIADKVAQLKDGERIAVPGAHKTFIVKQTWRAYDLHMLREQSGSKSGVRVVEIVVLPPLAPVAPNVGLDAGSILEFGSPTPGPAMQVSDFATPRPRAQPC